uniref:GFO/IDH/MocA-like oxidoreductase domain-containing protein n=2 Tax=Octopus bimaculoides TaxID=37653 RepID=A0A0L8GZ49_OCTBM
MLNNGKPVLCEQTCANNTKQTEEMIELAKSKKLFFMEGMWSNFFPAYKALREIIDSGTIGKIHHLDATMFYEIPPYDAGSDAFLDRSGLIDIGIYLIWLANFIFKQKPETITAVGVVTDISVDQSANLTLTYKDGAKASLSYDRTVTRKSDAHIYGTQGKIYIHSPLWSTTKIEINGEEREFPLPKSDAVYNYPNSAGLAYEAEAVRQCFEKGELECPAHTHSDTLSLINIIDEARRQLKENHQKK